MAEIAEMIVASQNQVVDDEAGRKEVAREVILPPSHEGLRIVYLGPQANGAKNGEVFPTKEFN